MTGSDIEMENLETLRADVREIKNALIGNPYTENRGLVNQVQEQETRITMLEDKFNNGKWLLLGLAFGSGAGLTSLIAFLADVFFKKH